MCSKCRGNAILFQNQEVGWVSCVAYDCIEENVSICKLLGGLRNQKVFPEGLIKDDDYYAIIEKLNFKNYSYATHFYNRGNRVIASHLRVVSSVYAMCQSISKIQKNKMTFF